MKHSHSLARTRVFSIVRTRIFGSYGYSLLELVTAIGILVTLVLVATPSFASLVAKNELTTASNTLLDSLYFARSHAIAHQQTVHICQRTPQALKCENDYGYNRDWSVGWLIFEDLNRDNEFDDNDILLKSVKIDGAPAIVFNQRGRLRFFADGSARSAGYYLCSKGQTEVRHVYLLHTGRARVDQKLSKKQLQTCAKSLL